MSSEHFWKVLISRVRLFLRWEDSGSSLWILCDINRDMKVNKEQPYVIMDGGINHLNYYGQAMGNETAVLYSLIQKEMRRQGEKKNPESFAVHSARSAMWS